jgi:allantoate deiminase
MSTLTDVGMIFVRCERGISHNPGESVTEEDAVAGAQVLLHVLENFNTECP